MPNSRRLACTAAAVCLTGALAAAGPVAAPAASVDAAFKKFWDARTPQQAANAVGAIVQSGVTFEDALARLKRGRIYSPDVPRGVARLSRRSGGRMFYYDLDVPRTYDPSRKYQVRVQLHGGVNGQDSSRPRGNGSIGELAGVEQIYVMPYCWSAAPWWSDAQIQNVRAILDSVKRTYNVDENRVALAGVSDGGTAAFYYAMRDATPFASFLSLNGFFLVLSSPTTETDGELLPNNLLNKPFFVVNGEMDPLYPTRVVDPYIERLRAGGVDVEYWRQAGAGHNTAWWPTIKDGFESFVRDHPRDPLPRTLTWENAGESLSNRAHWLVIDRLNDGRDGAPLPDLSDTALPEEDQPHSPKLFIHSTHFGRVDLVRTGNTVEATTRGVAEFTLLVSPDAFDLSQPIRVVANGRVVFDGRIQPSLATLLKWAARDNDRTMLFAAELHIKLE